MRPVQINFYTRRDCQLCDEALETLSEMASEFILEVIRVDVDSHPDLVQRYGNHVPVATVGDRELFRHRVSPEKLRRLLENL